MWARVTGWLASPLAKFLLVAAIIGGAWWAVTSTVARIDANGYSRAESKYKLQIAADDKKRADEVRRAQLEQEKKRLEQEAHVRELSAKLITADATIDVLTKRLQERASNVSNFYRPEPGTGLLAVPRWIVTNGWVCDYNRAIGYGLPGTGAAVGGDADPACTADAFSRSEVTGERILGHHEEYGGYCRKLEERVNVLLDHIEFIERKQGK